MVGLGTIINVGGVILGGLLGFLGGKLIKEHHQDALTKVCGVCVLFIGIGGALEEMLTVDGSSVTSGKGMWYIVKPFMERNGFRDGAGWWVDEYGKR